MNSRRFSTRVMFYVVSVITLILLLGSAALQRIVFKADQVASAIFIAPATLAVKPGNEATVRLHATFSGLATVAAAQFALSFDPNVIEVVATKTSASWATKKVNTTVGVLNWVMVPASSQGKIIELNGDVTFGEIVFRAIKDGRVSLNLVASDTRIVAVDPAQTPSIYNSVATTQSAILTVSSSAATTPIPPAPLPDADTKQSTSELQRLKTINEVIGTTAAQLFVTTNQPSSVSVFFGPDPHSLLNSVASSSSVTSTTLRLADLDTGGRYYYQIRAQSALGDTVLSKIYSFQTALPSNKGSIKGSSIAIYPTAARKNAVVYFVLTDDNGAAMTDLQPTLSATKGEVTLDPPVVVDGIYQSTISSKLSARQTVDIELAVDDRQLGGAAITFDPNLAAPTINPTDQASPSVPLSGKNLVILLTLSGLLAILGLLFYRLARAK